MIAVVSSTVAPSAAPSHDGPRTTLSPDVRLEQTRATVASLVSLGAREIVVADNSPGTWLKERVGALAPASVVHFDHPPFRNKGIGELWLLLSLLPSLGEGEPLLKISGRYKVGPGTGLLPAGDGDIAARVSGQGWRSEMSTRCYLLRNKAVAGLFWERALDELYAERARIAGPRSLLRILRNSFRPEGDSFRYADPNTLSLEQASVRAVRHLGLGLRRVETLEVEGVLGSWINPLIKE